MILKTYRLSPNQIAALLRLSVIDSAKFGMPINNAHPSFEFPVEEINTVAKVLATADDRPVDWTALDVSEELIDIDAVWIDSESVVKVRRLELQYDAHASIVTDWTIEPADLDLILHRAGYDPDQFCESGDNWEEHKNELYPAIVAHYLTRAEDENAMPELEKKTAIATANGTWAGVDADAYVESVRSGEYEATAITESPEKAKERYEAAIEFMGGEKELSKSRNMTLKISTFKFALKIAAGLPE